MQQKPHARIRKDKRRQMLLKNQLIIGFLMVALVPTLLFSVFFTRNTIRTIEENYAENRMRVVSQIVGNLAAQTQWIRAMHNQLVFDNGMSAILSRPPSEATRYDLDYKETVDRIGSQFVNTPIGSYISALIVKGSNGAELRFGKDAGNLDFQNIANSAWFQEVHGVQGFRWSALMPHFSKYSAIDRILSLYIRLDDSMTGREKGYAVLLLDHKIFRSSYDSLVQLDGDRIYLFNEVGELMSTNRIDDGVADLTTFGTRFGIDVASMRPMSPKLTGTPGTGSAAVAPASGQAAPTTVLDASGAYAAQPGTFTLVVDGTTNLVTWQHTTDGWLLAEVLPLTGIAGQHRVLLRTVAVMVAMAVFLSLMLSLFLTTTLTRPINRIVAQVRDIGLGRFGSRGEEAGTGSAGSRDDQAGAVTIAGTGVEVWHGSGIRRRDMEGIRPSPLRAPNEIGILDESIHTMQEDIRALLEENVGKEREKRRLEMQMLQSQINPHFLYNTLNTIRMMATLQGSEGIVRMLNALGGVMKYALGQSDEMVPLQTEIDALEEYVYINRIRFKGRISFEKTVEDEGLLQCAVPRFILQPIVENAIQHGLGPKKTPGVIRMRVSGADQELRIEIMDNGAGMTPERMNELRARLGNLDGQAGAGGRSSPGAGGRQPEGGVGLVNVQKRIRLLFGEPYGIEMDSVVGESTRMTLLLRRDQALLPGIRLKDGMQEGENHAVSDRR